WALHQQGLDWHPLLRSNRVDDHFLLAGIYGDLVFHLGAFSRDKDFRREALSGAVDLPFRLLPPRRRLLRALAPALPWARRSLDRWLASEEALTLSLRRNREVYERIRAELLADPEGYISYLRSGSRTAESSGAALPAAGPAAAVVDETPSGGQPGPPEAPALAAPATARS